MRTFSLSPHRGSHPLKEDGLSVCVAQCPKRPVNNLYDLREVFDLGDIGTVILFERQNISKVFMDRIDRTGFDRFPGQEAPGFNRWNWTGGNNVTNAVPHFHYPQTCIVAPTPTMIPTTLFKRRSVIRAAEEMSRSSSGFQSALSSIRNDKDTDSFFEKLHREWSLGLTTDTGKLRTLQQLQTHAYSMRGTFEVNLWESGYGMAVLPPMAVHARSLLLSLFRPESTIWRYFDKGK